MLLVALFLQSIPASILGTYIGYRYAIRNTPLSERPSGLWQLAASLGAGIGGTVLTVLVAIAVGLAFPNVDATFTTPVALLLGYGLGFGLTRRRFK